MGILIKRQRNALFNIIVAAGLDPAEFELTGSASEDRLTHKPSGSYFRVQRGSFLFLPYAVASKTWDDPVLKVSGDWSTVESRAQYWIKDVKEFMNIPDLWVEFRREQELISNAEYESISNALFDRNEQLRIAEQLREIKNYLADRHSLSGEELSHIEARLNEIEEATHRIGRKDWLMMFYGVMFTLMVTAILPPDAAQHIIFMVIHGLGDLFGFGQPPSSLPPVA